MAGTFNLGEQKTRPGGYFNVQKMGTDEAPGAVNGITVVVFRSDTGPLTTVVELNPDDGYADVFGTGGTTDAIEEAFNGGAATVLGCRVGNGGTKSSVELKDSSDVTAVTIEAVYPGKKTYMVTLRNKLTDSTKKECIIYDGTKEIVNVEFTAGEGEASSLVEALASSNIFKASVSGEQSNAVLANVTQSTFVAGTDPTVTNEDYSNAFSKIEPYEFNSICVDTENSEVHLLLQAFLDRIYEAGSFGMGVVAEPHTVNIDTRIAHAAAFNDNKMHYVLNAHVKKQDVELDGYKTAARITGMIGACSSNSSLTHTVINGFTEIVERLTNTQIIKAEKNGCIVLTYNSNNQVWIDSAINTLVTPAENQDDGWKKIRRTKTRFELIRRMNAVADNLVGKVDNDTDGRATTMSQLQAVGNDMVDEKKLVSCVVTENKTYKADGDSAWFDIDVVDKDSQEHIYLTFKFRYSTNVE